MEQNWEKVLFLHWPFEPSIVRPLVPPDLEIDTWDNAAWIGITPFALTGLRLYPMPAIPGLSSFDELNIRKYVHHNGKHGIFFLSLDASKLLPALAARIFYQLPYFAAEIKLTENEDGYQFSSTRTLNPSTRFEASWKRGVRLRAPDTESLAFFLIERYCFFTTFERQVSMTRAYHSPWILEEAQLEHYEATLLAASGLPGPRTARSPASLPGLGSNFSHQCPTDTLI